MAPPCPAPTLPGAAPVGHPCAPSREAICLLGSRAPPGALWGSYSPLLAWGLAGAQAPQALLTLKLQMQI